MIDISLVAVTVGLLAGVIGGMLPGIGHLLCLTIIMPWMVHWPAAAMFMCFAVMVQVSQFLGSLTTTFTRVPGELSSMPMLEELKQVPEHRLGEVVSSTAVGSMLGMIVSLLFCWALLGVMQYASYLFRTELMLMLMLAAVIMIFRLGRDSTKVKIGMVVLGMALGLLGYNQTLERDLLTFGITDLMAGIPYTVVLVCLFAMPQLYQIRNLHLAWQPCRIPLTVPWSAVKYSPMAATVGFVGGMMPGLATIFSSQVAYNLAKSRTQDPVQRIAASETANNAGAIGQMIPMLILGLPILSSEALVLALMESKGFQAGVGTGTQLLWSATGPLFATALIAVILAWPLALLTLSVLRVNMRILRVVALGLLCAIIFYQAWMDLRLAFTAVCFLTLAVLGWLIRRHDTMLLIFVFFISERLLDHAVRVVSLYS